MSPRRNSADNLTFHPMGNRNLPTEGGASRSPYCRSGDTDHAPSVNSSRQSPVLKGASRSCSRTFRSDGEEKKRTQYSFCGKDQDEVRIIARPKSGSAKSASRSAATSSDLSWSSRGIRPAPSFQGYDSTPTFNVVAALQAVVSRHGELGRRQRPHFRRRWQVANRHLDIAPPRSGACPLGSPPYPSRSGTPSGQRKGSPSAITIRCTGPSRHPRRSTRSWLAPPSMPLAFELS